MPAGGHVSQILGIIGARQPQLTTRGLPHDTKNMCIEILKKQQQCHQHVCPNSLSTQCQRLCFSAPQSRIFSEQIAQSPRMHFPP